MLNVFVVTKNKLGRWYFHFITLGIDDNTVIHDIGQGHIYQIRRIT